MRDPSGDLSGSEPMLPIISALVSRVADDHFRPQALAGQGSVGGALQDRVSIGFQYSSRIGKAPWPSSPDGSRSWASRARTIRSRISQQLSWRPNLSASV